MNKYLVVATFVFLSGCANVNSLLIPSYDILGPYKDLKGYGLGVTISGTLTKPEGNGPFPTVILMHGCSGLDAAVRAGLNSHAGFLVENGYVALVLDSFSRRGKSGGGVCSSFAQLGKARFYRKIDAYNAFLFLKTLPYVDKRNIFLMGQSNGGSVALGVANQNQDPEISNELSFNAIVAFYPWCGALPRTLRTPLLVLGGAEDDWTPIQPCFSAKGRNMGKPYEVIKYENAHHSFDLFISVQSYSGHTVGGNSEARSDSKKQMLSWFEKFRI